MRVSVVGGQKGGTGKSMITGNLAACFARLGAKVGIIDTDYSQNTTDKWSIVRSSAPVSHRIDCIVRHGPELQDQLDEWADSEIYDHVFVDTNGSDSWELRMALTRASLFISPVKPHASDNWTLGALDKLVTGAREVNGALRCRIVMSIAATHRGRREAELGATLAALREYPSLQVCRTVISDRSIYPIAWASGRGVAELSNSRSTTSAIEEMTQLHQEIYL